MWFFPGYFDPMYLVFALPALILAFFAQYKVHSTYAKYSRVHNMLGLSGLDAARWLLGSSGLSHVNVEGAPGRGWAAQHHVEPTPTLALSTIVSGSRWWQ